MSVRPSAHLHHSISLYYSHFSLKCEMSYHMSNDNLSFLYGNSREMFGVVYEGRWNTNTEVAIKTLRQGSMTSEAFLHEALIMHKLRHEKLVRLFAVCSKCEPIYIITELMANGNLLNYLRSPIGKILKLPVLIDIATQVKIF